MHILSHCVYIYSDKQINDEDDNDDDDDELNSKQKPVISETFSAKH